MRLLVVEDERDLAEAVTGHLRAVTHAVDRAATLDEAEAAVRVVSYDLVLLDLRLPDGDGLSLLKGMRDRGDVAPVLIVTARDRILERIEGLEAGADDYLVKPYDLDEMLARVTAISRRADNLRMPEHSFGDLTIKPRSRTVLRGGEEVRLTPREWALLDRLSRRPEVTISKGDLETAIYGFDEEVESNAVEAHISRLRGKLGREVVETVRGFGYRMGRG